MRRRLRVTEEQGTFTDDYPSHSKLTSAASLDKQRYDLGNKPIPGVSGRVIHSVHRWIPATCCRFHIAFGQQLPAPTDIRMRPPSKYTHESNVYPTKRFEVPLSWLARKWIISHTTYPTWRLACNILHSYWFQRSFQQLDLEISSIPFASGRWRQRLNYVVQYRSLGFPVSRQGFSVQDHGTPGWKWRGKGWRKIESFRWEILGWGERSQARGTMCWLVIWSSAGLLFGEGVDIYCDHPGGLSDEIFEEIMDSLLKTVDSPRFREFLSGNLTRVYVRGCGKREDLLRTIKYAI